MKTRAAEIEAAALEFHNQNPEVWELFKCFTRQIIARGFSNYSSKAVFERIRWETDEADVDGRSTFKINNNYQPHYARWFMARYPQHDGFFRTRALSSSTQEPVDLPELTPSDFD